MLNADERRKRRRLEERSRVKHLSAANKEHRKEIKNLQRQARSLEEELSVLKKENDKYRKEMSEFKLRNLFSRTRPAANGIIMNIRDYVKMALREKEEEVQRCQRKYENILSLYKSKVAVIKDAAKESGRLDKLKERYEAALSRDKTCREECAELQLELDVCQKQLRLAQELEEETVALAKENKALKGKMERLKRSVEDLAFDLDGQSKRVVEKKEAEKTFLRLFSSGFSVAEVMTFIREMRKLLGYESFPLACQATRCVIERLQDQDPKIREVAATLLERIKLLKTELVSRRPALTHS